MPIKRPIQAIRFLVWLQCRVAVYAKEVELGYISKWDILLAITGVFLVGYAVHAVFVH